MEGRRASSNTPENLGGAARNRRRRHSIAVSDRMAARKASQQHNTVAVKAGFYPVLLPTWGGKAKDILQQPKCWTSKNVTAVLRRSEHERLLEGQDEERVAALYGPMTHGNASGKNTAEERALALVKVKQCSSPFAVSPTNQVSDDEDDSSFYFGSNSSRSQSRLLSGVDNRDLYNGAEDSQDMKRCGSQASSFSEAIEKFSVASEGPLDASFGQLEIFDNINHESGIGIGDQEICNDQTVTSSALLVLDKNVGKSMSNNHIKPNSAIGTVLAKCNAIRDDPAEYKALLERIKKYKDANSFGKRERNLIIENKWLNSDKKACVEYWNDIRALRARIAQTDSIDLKIGLYGLWPTPPAPNHSQKDVAKKFKARGRELERRIQETRNRRERQDEERLERVHALLNKKETEAEEKRAHEKATRVHAALWPIIVSSHAALALEQAVQEVLAKTAEKRLQHQMASVIQNRWRKTRAPKNALQFRNAISVVRRFAKKAIERRQVKKVDRSIKIIHWFLTSYENSNFQKVMRNYRYRVISCQRHFKGYQSITNARLKALSLKWDQVEKDKMRVERQKLMSQMRNQQIEMPRGGLGAAGFDGNAINQNGSQSHGKMLRQGTVKQIRSGPPGGPMSRQPTSRLGAGAAGGLKGGPASNMMHMGGGAAPIMPNMPRKVAKDIKREILLAYLKTQRLNFKAYYQNHARARKYMEAQSRLMTIEDMRSVVRASSDSEMRKVYDRKVEENKGNSTRPFLSILTNTTEAILGELIEQGRQMVSEETIDMMEGPRAAQQCSLLTPSLHNSNEAQARDTSFRGSDIFFQT